MSDPQDETWDFDWGTVRGEVSALGAMLGPVWFRQSDGTEVQPFAIGDWAGDPAAQRETLPPILRRLRGEWPCVPFGVPETRTDLPDRWMAGIDADATVADSFIHGYSSNHLWHLSARTDRSLTLSIDYPDGHPVRSLERGIALDESGGLDISLRIAARRDADLPIGVHPVLRLPDRTGAAHLSIPSLRRVHSFPVAVEPGVSILTPDRSYASLTGLQTHDGAPLDASRLPLPRRTVELLLVELDTGAVSLRNADEGYETRISWDIASFPFCLLWIENGGRAAYPWQGRFSAIGIEPIAGAFDLGQVHSTNPRGPLSGSSRALTARLRAGETWETRYRIATSAI
ncbi:hypothetical protein AB0T83_16525 [Fluviibacterium sp. DFM31]|uniref:Aldose 1-epimerase n=1 Tax=Meridianimarinicoccus marinus TaxID=3231483 RepID=A0ABV3LA51_9RHOB